MGQDELVELLSLPFSSFSCLLPFYYILFYLPAAILAFWENAMGRICLIYVSTSKHEDCLKHCICLKKATWKENIQQRCSFSSFCGGLRNPPDVAKAILSYENTIHLKV